MGQIAPLATFAALSGLLLVTAAPVASAFQDGVKLAQAAAKPEPLVQSDPRQLAQAQARPRSRAQSRPRARIRVYSRYPYRHYHSIYPLPYPTEYPGPNALRHCVNHYLLERRPSGDVIVPHTRCWWAPG
jgi:hypothetical protein